MSTQLLAQFAEAIADGSVKVVDLTQTLKPATTVDPVAAALRQSDPFRISEISHYESANPAVLEQLSMGEHTGTHFDAP